MSLDSLETERLDKRTLRIVFYVISLAIVSAGLVMTVLEDWPIRDAIAPQLVGGIFIVLLVTELYLTVTGKRDLEATGSGLLAEATDTLEDSEDASDAEPEESESPLVTMLWILSVPLAIYLIGVTITVVLYPLLFIWVSMRDARTAIVTTVIILAIYYILFVTILAIPMWEGILGLPDPVDWLG